MSIHVRAVPFVQRKIQMYAAVLPLNILDRFSIDVWDPKNILNQRGYQRSPEDEHVRSIAKYLERSDSIMPVAGLLNVREKGRLKFKHNELIIPDGTRVWVVDMQHRLKALVQAHEDGFAKDGSFYFPAIITEGLDRVDEAAQFYVINTKAKKMNVALTRRLLIENAKVKYVSDVKPWEISAVKAAIELNERLVNNPWHGRLRQPNEEKMVRHVATETSFVSSLRQLFLSNPQARANQIAKELSLMWTAVRIHIPECFQEPRKYQLQRTPGMFAFNFFIAPAFLTRHSQKDYSKALSGLKKLGPNFWKRSNKSGAGRFGSGMAGYSNLADYLEEKYIK
jgi:DGQHR domain-containing protein